MTLHANVDPLEIAKFSAHAHTWWDPQGEFGPLHAINPLRLTWIRQRCGDLKGIQILDIGCGGGLLTEALTQCGAHVTGIDLSEKALGVARLHGVESQLDIHYELSSAETFAHTHAHVFDIVTCMEMLEHVPNPTSVVHACARLVKPGGHVLLSTLNRNVKSYLCAILGAEYVLNMLPRGTHDWQKFIRPSELCRQARIAGLHTKAITGLRYNPLTRHYSLNNDVGINYLIDMTLE